MPAYVVASDETLASIAAARPTTLTALERVKGIGPAKLDRYGADIVAIVAAAPPPNDAAHSDGAAHPDGATRPDADPG